MNALASANGCSWAHGQSDTAPNRAIRAVTGPPSATVANYFPTFFAAPYLNHYSILQAISPRPTPRTHLTPILYFLRKETPQLSAQRRTQTANVTAGAIIPKVPVENSPAPAMWSIPASSPSAGGAVGCYGGKTCTNWNR